MCVREVLLTGDTRLTPALKVSLGSAATAAHRHDVTARRPSRPVEHSAMSLLTIFPPPSLIWSLTIVRGVEPEVCWTLLPVMSARGLAPGYLSFLPT